MKFVKKHDAFQKTHPKCFITDFITSYTITFFIISYRVGIPASMLGYMGRSFMAAIEPTLTESNAWNPETEEAWQKLLKWITYGMQRGYDSGTTGQNKDQQKPLEEENQISTKIPPPISLAEVAENLQAIDVDGGDDDPNSTTSIEDENT